MRTLIIAGLLWATGAGAAAAQPPGGAVGGRVSVWGGLTLAGAATGGTLSTGYAPVLDGASGYSSRASQRLAIDTSGGAGVAAGADVFLSRRVGIQAAITWCRAGLSGSPNGDYALYLRYVSRQPPDYAPQEYVIDRSEAWPDTAGHYAARALQLGVVARIRSSAGSIEGTFAGGLSLNSVAAEPESVAYTEFRLGGHGVLFESQSRVAVSTAGAGTFARPYLAADIGVRAANRVRLFAGVRAQLGSPPPLAVRPARIVDAEQALWRPELAQVERVLTMEPARVALPHWQLVAGLRVAIR